MARPIKIESIPMDENGQPRIGEVSGVPGKVRVIDADGTREVDGVRVKTTMEEKSIVIRSANIGKVIDMFPGTKLTLYLTDALNGQQCPPTMCLGEVVLVKDKVYELEYDNLPINGWTVRDRSDVKNPNAKQLCYPEGIRNQKELMDLILGHESTFTCPFAKWHLTYPEEVQEKMDMDALDTREKALAERKAEVEKKFKKQEEELQKERARMAKVKKGE